MTGDLIFYTRALLFAPLSVLATFFVFGFSLTSLADAWTVSPANVHLSAKPGLITRGSFDVITSDSVGRHFRVVAQNLGETPSGSFTFTPPGHSAADWVEVLPATFAGSKQPQPVDYAISVPSNAAPGDHVAAISVQELPASLKGNLGVVEAVGIRVIVRIPGKVYAGAKIAQFHAPSLTFGNGVAVHAVVINTGNTVLDFNNANRGSGITVGREAYPITGLLLPGATRIVSYGWNNPPLLGSTAAHLHVNLGESRRLSASTSIFAFPLYQVLGLTLLIMAAYMYRRHNNRNSSPSSDNLAIGGA
jgi:hypothetical protein